MLCLSSKYEDTIAVYHMMNGGIKKQQNISEITLTSPSYTNKNMNSSIYTISPSTFTIAEMIRAARQMQSMWFAYEVLTWGIHQQVSIPIGVISDAIDLLYSKGLTLPVQYVYQQLYTQQYITHWHNDSQEYNKILDVHGFNQGMTYAAVTSAMKEILYSCKNNIYFRQKLNDLIIITGTNVGEEKDKLRESRSSETFKLSTEVQRALVENFLPPISSSTVNYEH
jgi:hypothetical protein